MTTAEKMKICSDCKQEPATINYAESILDLTHGFNRWICKKCYDKIRDNNPWYKQGFQAGENSKHKSDLQRELEFLESPIKENSKNWVKERINLIKKKLKEIEK
jgi:protein-arginine kinase activator protein McsA